MGNNWFARIKIMYHKWMTNIVDFSLYAFYTVGVFVFSFFHSRWFTLSSPPPNFSLKQIVCPPPPEIFWGSQKHDNHSERAMLGATTIRLFHYLNRPKNRRCTLLSCKALVEGLALRVRKSWMCFKHGPRNNFYQYNKLESSTVTHFL